MSYTKGPWEFDYRNERVTDSEGNTVVWETNSNIHDGNLIAAAPELLEALEMAMEIGDGCSRGFLAKFQEKARSAIAKAKGELR